MAAPEDKEAALFDLLAGWADYIDQKVKRVGEGTGRSTAGSWSSVSARWRLHYTESYVRRVRALRDLAGTVLWDEDSEEGMRADEFVRSHLLRLFEPDPE
jgi:hypothetical protein